MDKGLATMGRGARIRPPLSASAHPHPPLSLGRWTASESRSHSGWCECCRSVLATCLVSRP